MHKGISGNKYSKRELIAKCEVYLSGLTFFNIFWISMTKIGHSKNYP